MLPTNSEINVAIGREIKGWFAVRRDTLRIHLVLLVVLSSDQSDSSFPVPVKVRIPLTKTCALSSSVCVLNPVSPMARHAPVPPQLPALLPCPL